jgi:hypothetical protein
MLRSVPPIKNLVIVETQQKQGEERRVQVDWGFKKITFKTVIIPVYDIYTHAAHKHSFARIISFRCTRLQPNGLYMTS